jgi:hypothetical protein
MIGLWITIPDHPLPLGGNIGRQLAACQEAEGMCWAQTAASYGCFNHFRFKISPRNHRPLINWQHKSNQLAAQIKQDIIVRTCDHFLLFNKDAGFEITTRARQWSKHPSR